LAERLVLSALLTAAFFFLFEDKRSWKAHWALRAVLFALLSWYSLGWTRSVRLYPDAFPLELGLSRAIVLSAGAVVTGMAAFAASRGRGGLLPGAVFGFAASLSGAFASRWPQLARAIELCDGTFLAVTIAVFLTTALACTHAALAAALVHEDWKPYGRRIILAVLLVWGGATLGAETALTRVWGFGPRSLPEAAGVPTNRWSRMMSVAWLYPTRGHSYHVDARRMSSETTDLSTDSLERLEAFLQRSGFRGVFAGEALDAVRLGWYQWWEEERALDAVMISVPGRAHPDYRRALELLRAGPLTAERFGKLEQLSAATGRRVEGFEKASDTQLIFEGFSATYARFGDEARAREWLGRLDGLWAVSEKRIEAGSLEDLREGRVDGSAFLDDRPAIGLRVGLFLVWTSSATRETHYWLSGSRIPDEDGRFSIDGLGPGRYALALLGRQEDLRGSFTGAPGYFEITYERPDVLLKPVHVRRDLAPSTDAFSPGGLPAYREPVVPEPPMRLGR
jgi:hypothetical protein